MSTLKTTNLQHPSAGSPAVELTAAGGLWLAGGKILQVVRATDGTLRTTTSTSYVDVTGMSVTITPQKSDSSILLLASFSARTFTSTAGGHRFLAQITDSSNVAISGSEEQSHGPENYSISGTGAFYARLNLIAYASPATTSAVSYKLRHRVATSTTTAQIRNDTNTGQMFAIEVSA